MVQRFAPSLALALAAAPLGLFACTVAPPAGPARASLPMARIAGPAQSCVPIHQLGTSRIRDDRTIDFLGSGRSGWRVTLPQPCSGLKAADAFSYATSLSQLCSTDIIRVVHQAGGLHPGASCGLGPFVPVQLER